MADKKMINLTIDDIKISVEEGATIVQAAKKIGVNIPTLCYQPDLSIPGACRVCIVEVKDSPFYIPACSTTVAEGMVVQTNSPQIRQARRDIVELLLDNHPKECQTCERDGNCELQNLAYTLGVRHRIFEGERKDFPVDDSSASVVREPNKCILCGRCIRVCAEVQGVNNLSQHGRGFTTVVSPAHIAKMDESVCIQCGQCINVCPTAALIEKDSTEQIWAAIADPKKHVVVHTAPSIRAAVGEGFDMPVGTPCTGKLASALKLLGFDGVFDTNFGADLTIVEESHEFLDRLAGKGPLPLLTSCSPGWISYLEKFYPQLIPNASSCRSPMGMTSALLKTYYAKNKGIDPKDIFVVSVMPCVAKKFEAKRPEHRMEDGTPFTDAVLTTRELIWMIQSFGIDFASLPDALFDDPFGKITTGAADIFGTTGGVMEATLRTAIEKVEGKPVERLDFTEVRAVEGLREAELKVGGTTIRVAVANGLRNAAKILEQVVKGEKQYHAIEVMACPGGCIGGGGQPYPPHGMKPLDHELLRLRAQALYTIDKSKEIRRSHDNPSIKKIYEEFLGSPGSELAHKLLHTHYSARTPRGIIP